jgi:putative membrane protein insertion efficiency factor
MALENHPASMMPRIATTIGVLILCLCLLWTPACVSACGSCLGSIALSGVGISSTKPTGRSRGGLFPRHAYAPSATSKTPDRRPISKSALGLLAIRHLLSQADFSAAWKNRIDVFASDQSGDAEEATTDTDSSSSSTSDGELQDMLSDDNYETPEQRGVDPEYMARSREGRMTAGMTGAIGFYKGWISPILPPACRFVPTCSQYGVQAIQEFGPARGAFLTAWRLMRCSPLGGKGYDPPRWPPVPFNYASY